MLLCLKRPAGCYLLILFCCTHSVRAQHGDSLVLKELEEVQVNSSKKRFQAASVTPVQSLSGAALQQLNSFSVADAIRYFSGVQLKDYGGIGGLKTVNVRSLGSQHVGVFLDGVGIGNAQNGTVDLGKFSLDNIESLELYNGHNPDLLQPARAFFASSGLYLKTIRPVFDTLQTTKLRTAFKTGSFGLANPSLLWQQKLPGALALSVNAEFLTANGKYRFYRKEGLFDTTATRQNADITAIRTEAGLFKAIKASGEAFIKAYYYQSNRGLPGAVVEGRFYNPQRLWDRNFFLHGSYKNSYSSGYTQLLSLKYSNDYTRYLDPSYITTTGPLNNIYKQQEVYASLAQKYSVKNWWEIGFSTDFSYNKLNANLYRFAYPSRYSYIGTLANNFKWERLTVQAALLYCYFDERVKQYESSGDRQAFSPTLALSWQPFAEKGLRLRSFYKESLRMPTFNDLYYTLVGNIALNPEYTRQYDVGFTWINDKPSFFDNFSVQADAYYNHIRDKIVAVPSANLFRWMMFNIGSVAVKGVEINTGLTKTLFQQLIWNAGLSYTWQQALNKTKGESSYDQQIPNTPVHSGTAHGSLSWKSWALNYSYLYTGDRYVLPENIATNYSPAWYTTDLGLVYENKNSNKKWKAVFEVNNVWNQYYDVVLNFPMPGRNYRVTFNINLK